MVIIDQLRISEDGSQIFIDFHVNEASYFSNVYLKSITIKTADKVSETDPEDISTGYIYYRRYSLDVKEDHLVIDRGSFDEAFTHGPIPSEEDGDTHADTAFDGKDFSSTMFFVYIDVRGVPDECTPCGLDKYRTLGITFDEKLIYQKAMGFTKSLAATCQIPSEFTDFILLWNALKAAISTGHYIPAIKFWNMLFGTADELESRDGSHSPYGKGVISTTFNCKCHG